MAFVTNNDLHTSDIITLPANDEFPTQMECILAGDYNFITKPLVDEEFKFVESNLVEKKPFDFPLEYQRSDLYVGTINTLNYSLYKKSVEDGNNYFFLNANSGSDTSYLQMLDDYIEGYDKGCIDPSSYMIAQAYADLSSNSSDPNSEWWTVIRVGIQNNLVINIYKVDVNEKMELRVSYTESDGSSSSSNVYYMYGRNTYIESTKSTRIAITLLYHPATMTIHVFAQREGVDLHIKGPIVNYPFKKFQEICLGTPSGTTSLATNYNFFRANPTFSTYFQKKSAINGTVGEMWLSSNNGNIQYFEGSILSLTNQVSVQGFSDDIGGVGFKNQNIRDGSQYISFYSVYNTRSFAKQKSVHQVIVTIYTPDMDQCPSTQLGLFAINLTDGGSLQKGTVPVIYDNSTKKFGLTINSTSTRFWTDEIDIDFSKPYIVRIIFNGLGSMRIKLVIQDSETMMTIAESQEFPLVAVYDFVESIYMSNGYYNQPFYNATFDLDCNSKERILGIALYVQKGSGSSSSAPYEYVTHNYWMGDKDENITMDLGTSDEKTGIMVSGLSTYGTTPNGMYISDVSYPGPNATYPNMSNFLNPISYVIGSSTRMHYQQLISLVNSSNKDRILCYYGSILSTPTYFGNVTLTVHGDSSNSGEMRFYTNLIGGKYSGTQGEKELATIQYIEGYLGQNFVVKVEFVGGDIYTTIWDSIGNMIGNTQYSFVDFAGTTLGCLYVPNRLPYNSLTNPSTSILEDAVTGLVRTKYIITEDSNLIIEDMVNPIEPV